MKMKFPADLMQEAQTAQRMQDQRFDVLLQLVEYLARANNIDDQNSDHPMYIKYAYACLHEWHNEILKRLALTETEE